MKSEVTVGDMVEWLVGLAEDDYEEDGLLSGSSDWAVKGVVVCWFANAGARAAALERGANLILMHEERCFGSPRVDGGCPEPGVWRVNGEIERFYAENRIAAVRGHRTLDAYCLPRVLAARLDLPDPAVRSGFKGYDFTWVYDITPAPLRELALRFGSRMGLKTVGVSAYGIDDPVRRVGLGWGGSSNSMNLQYMELLRDNGAETVIAGEVDEYAIEFFRDSRMRWIELGHYATEIPGMQSVSQELAAKFPSVPVHCYLDGERRTTLKME